GLRAAQGRVERAEERIRDARVVLELGPEREVTVLLDPEAERVAVGEPEVGRRGGEGERGVDPVAVARDGDRVALLRADDADAAEGDRALQVELQRVRHAAAPRRALA